VQKEKRVKNDEPKFILIVIFTKQKHKKLTLNKIIQKHDGMHGTWEGRESMDVYIEDDEENVFLRYFGLVVGIQ